MSTLNKAGLEDVVVSTSDICFIDGHEGRLVYRGYDVDDLAAQSTFEEVVYLLWFGALPTKKEYDAFYKTMSATATRRLPPKLVDLLRGLPRKTTPMEVLRTGVSALSAFDPDAADNSREASLRKATRLTAQMPTLVAAWERIRRGKPLVTADPRLNLAANFLYMMSGKKPTRWPPRPSTSRSSCTPITSSTPPPSPPASPRPRSRTCTRPSPRPSAR